ncbi:MAG: hypothetical protein U1F26_13315 [Lysobacterales bacterium]
MALLNTRLLLVLNGLMLLLMLVAGVYARSGSVAVVLYAAAPLLGLMTLLKRRPGRVLIGVTGAVNGLYALLTLIALLRVAAIPFWGPMVVMASLCVLALLVTGLNAWYCGRAWAAGDRVSAPALN